MKPLSRSFYLRSTPRVAKELLGKYLVRRLRGKKLIGKIVETEAYCTGDPASHSYRGKTKRNAVMFGNGGYLYVYFTYGMHYCANVVTQHEGIGEAVLIRAVEPVAGIETMLKNRTLKMNPHTSPQHPSSPAPLLTNGPAMFCQAFAIARKENGTDLLGNTIYITHGEKIPRSQIGRSSRIGINYGKEKLWRFSIKNNRWVSRKSPAAT